MANTAALSVRTRKIAAIALGSLGLSVLPAAEGGDLLPVHPNESPSVVEVAPSALATHSAKEADKPASAAAGENIQKAIPVDRPSGSIRPPEIVQFRPIPEAPAQVAKLEPSRMAKLISRTLPRVDVNYSPPPIEAQPYSFYHTHNLWVEEFPAAYQAAAAGDHDLLQTLLLQGADPEATTPAGDTPLCAAVRAHQPEMVELLLRFGANPNRPGREKQTPLVLASLERSGNALRALLAGGADPNVPIGNPVDPKLLVKVTIRDLKHYLEVDTNVTPLMACAARGDVEGAVALMAHGAKTGAHTKKYGRYALNFSATQGYLFLMRVLLGRSPDAEPDTIVTVDLSKQRAWVTKKGQVVDSTKISTGREGFETPPGRYVVTDKHRHHVSNLYHVDMPWFMRLNSSAIGLHSGYVTGRPASHGCIRLPYEKAKDFFYLVGVGDEVEIVE